MASSSHLANIPQAVRIAAGLDPALGPEVKHQAVEYLAQVKEEAQETWQVGRAGYSVLTRQDCLSLYLQGAGAPGPSTIGKDGKQKLSTELRMFCEQVVDSVLISK